MPDGLVIETSVLARLFGVKLLTLEGTVLVSPAHLRALGATASPSPPAAAPPPPQYDARDASRQPAGQAGLPPAGTRLGLAARLLDETADQLRDLG